MQTFWFSHLFEAAPCLSVRKKKLIFLFLVPKLFFGENFLVPRRVNILERDPPTSFTIHTRGFEYKAASDASLSHAPTHWNSLTHTPISARTLILRKSVLLTFNFFLLAVFETHSCHFSLYVSSFIVTYTTIEESKCVCWKLFLGALLVVWLLFHLNIIFPLPHQEHL